MTITRTDLEPDFEPPLDDADRHRPHPSVLNAERAVAGAALLTTAMADAAAEIITPADFFDPELATVFQAATDLAGTGTPVDAITVHHHLATTGQLGLLRRSGPRLLADLLAETPATHPHDAAAYAHIVADDAHRRRIHTALVSAAQYTGSPDFTRDDTDTVISRITTAATGTGRPGTDEPTWFDDDLTDTLTDLETPTTSRKIPTPWRDIDAGVSLEPGQLVIVAARPGGGKSLVGLNIAAHVAIRHGEGAMIASLEMTRPQLQRRLLAAEAKVNLHNLEHKTLNEADWTAISHALPRIQGAPLLIDTSADITVPRLRSRLRYMRSRVTTRLIVVDYLQLMRTSGRERRDLELAEISRALKLLAVDMGACVIALSQLNRESEKRHDKRPQLSDLRESGALENDADTVILLSRPPEDSPMNRRGDFDMTVAKQRSGPAGFTVSVAWQGQYARVVDFAA